MFFKYFSLREQNTLKYSELLNLFVLTYCQACEELASTPEDFAIMCSGWQSELLQETYFSLFVAKHHGDTLQIGQYEVLVL